MIKERKVFLDDLPRLKNCKINWKGSIGYKVKFIYDDIEGLVEIVDVIDRHLYIKYLDKSIFKIAFSSFSRGMFGKLLEKVTDSFKVEIGQVFEDDKRYLVITDRKYRYRESNKGYIDKQKWYKYKCNKCGYEDWIIEGHLLEGNGCKPCGGTIAVEGYNDIPTTAPYLIPYFQGGYDEAKLYTKNSNRKIVPVCPHCNNIHYKYSAINKLNLGNGFNCIYCSDGIKYPEKLMFSILKQLNVIFSPHKIFEWSNKKEYDFYVNSLDMIIETHGLQHYKKQGWKNSKPLEEQKTNDNYKEQLALTNNIKEYIVIDCRYSELEYIKQNILKSKLNELFDLSIIYWNKVEEFALSNRVKEACDYCKNNPIMTPKTISEIMNMSRTTISKYLKIGTKLGWCKYDGKQRQRDNFREVAISKGKPIEIFKDGTSLGIHKNATDLERESEKLFGIKLLQSGISEVCLGHRKKHKGFTFKYI